MAAPQQRPVLPERELEPVPLPVGFVQPDEEPLPSTAGLLGALDSQIDSQQQQQRPQIRMQTRPASAVGQGPLVQELQTFDVGRSSVLDRVANFLPSLKSANEQLQELIVAEGPDRFNIEHMDNPAGARIEMDLALGVLELQRQRQEGVAGEDCGIPDEGVALRIQQLLGLAGASGGQPLIMDDDEDGDEGNEDDLGGRLEDDDSDSDMEGFVVCEPIEAAPDTSDEE